MNVLLRLRPYNTPMMVIWEQEHAVYSSSEILHWSQQAYFDYTVGCPLIRAFLLFPFSKHFFQTNDICWSIRGHLTREASFLRGFTTNGFILRRSFHGFPRVLSRVVLCCTRRIFASETPSLAVFPSMEWIFTMAYSIPCLTNPFLGRIEYWLGGIINHQPSAWPQIVCTCLGKFHCPETRIIC